MIEFNKKDLEFLSIYNFCSGGKAPHSDKLLIKVIGDNILFTQISDKVEVHKVIPNTSECKDFTVILPITEFYKMISFCKEDDKIVFLEDSIKFGSKSDYKFETYDNMESVYNVSASLSIMDSLVKYDEVELKDLKKLSEIKFSKGADAFDIFSLQSGYFVCNDGRFMTSVIKTENLIERNYWFSFFIYDVSKFLGVDEIKIYMDKENDRYVINYDGTYIVSHCVDAIIMDIFKEDVKRLYDHPNKVNILKSDLSDIVNRISIVTDVMHDNRINVLFKEDEITFENKYGIQGNESLVIKLMEILQNQQVILQSLSLNKVISSLKDELIFSFPDEMDKAGVIKIEDTKKDKFFILNLMELEG